MLQIGFFLKDSPLFSALNLLRLLTANAGLCMLLDILIVCAFLLRSPNTLKSYIKSDFHCGATGQDPFCTYI